MSQKLLSCSFDRSGPQRFTLGCGWAALIWLNLIKVAFEWFPIAVEGSSRLSRIFSRICPPSLLRLWYCSSWSHRTTFPGVEAGGACE